MMDTIRMDMPPLPNMERISNMLIGNTHYLRLERNGTVTYFDRGKISKRYYQVDAGLVLDKIEAINKATDKTLTNLILVNAWTHPPETYEGPLDVVFRYTFGIGVRGVKSRPERVDKYYREMMEEIAYYKRKEEEMIRKVLK